MSDIFTRLRDLVKNGPESEPVSTQLSQEGTLIEEEPDDVADSFRETLSADNPPFAPLTRQQIVDANILGPLVVPRMFGKTNVYLDFGIEDDTLTDYFDNLVIREGNQLPETDIADPLRFVSQKYWSTIDKADDNPSVYFNKSSFDTNQKVPFTIEIGKDTTGVAAGVVYPERTSIALVANKQRFTGTFSDPDNTTFNQSLWESYVEGVTYRITGRPDLIWDPIVNLSEKYMDHAFLLDTPFSKKELNSVNPPNSKKIEAISEVNFVLEDYFDTIGNGEIDDNLLPNVYSLRAQVNLGENDTIVKKHNTLDNNIEGVLEKSQDNNVITFQDSVNYLDAWIKAISNVPTDVRETLSRKYTNIILSPEEIGGKLYEEIRQASETFPANIHLEFSADGVGAVSTAFRDARLSTKVLEHISQTQAAYEATADGILGALSPEFSQRSFKHCKCYEGNFSMQNVDLDIYDMEEWLEKLENEEESFNLGDIGIQTTPQFQDAGEQRKQEVMGLLKKIAREESVFLDVFKDKEESENMSEFYKSLLMLVFRSRLRGIVKNHFRTFLQIMKGDPCYSDTIAYKISKHEVDSSGIPSAQPKQSIYFFNNDDMIHYIDTQVKYNKSYVYRIWAYVAVVGNEYSYAPRRGEDSVVFEENNGEAKALFDVINNPSVKIIETPYYTTNPLRCLERPPLPPQVQFIPYLGSDNELLISMSNPAGQMLDVPILVNERDRKPIFYMTEAQEPDNEGRIEYRGDDQIRVYEVYRSSTMPTNYTDFSGELVAYVDSALPESGQHTTEVSYIDRIIPNQKFYYMVRSIDVNNNLSNPSKIYEVEMVSNSGIIYPVIREVQLRNEQRNKYKTKSVSKYMRVKLALPQTLINMERSGLELTDNPIGSAKKLKLGTREESAWDRKFKIRLTSKETGRKIDINLRFKYVLSSKKFQVGAKLEGSPELVVVEADSFSQALQLLLIEQSDALI